MTRVQDWPSRLAELITWAEHRPLAWGSHDCCTLAADAVQATTGTDPLADLRGTYSTEAEAAAVLARLGGLRAAMCARFGEPLPNVLLAQRGDLVLIAAGNTLAMAVCTGHLAVAPGPDRLQRIPMAATRGDTRPLAAWRI